MPPMLRRLASVAALAVSLATLGCPAHAEEAWHWRRVLVCLPAEADEFLKIGVGV